MPTPTHGDFKLTSRARIDLPISIFQRGPWTHLATVNRSLQEYVAILHEPTQKIYLEQIGATGNFYQIADDKLWEDLLRFLVSRGILGFNKNQEIIQGVDFGK